MTILGVDLGTTNSACGVWRNEKAELIPNALGDFLTPSVVYIDPDNQVHVGKVAQERSITEPQATASVFKRYMGTHKSLTLRGKDYTAVELSAFILSRLKEDAEKFLGETVTQAVISVPAYFNDTQRKATKQAGEMAGLTVERLVNEPTAAAIAYGLHEKPEHAQFMVLDLGGGTFDVSIMEYFSGVLEVHASSGDNFLGGEDFLEVLVNHYLEAASLNRKQLSHSELQKIRSKLEQVKRQFNTVESVTIEPILHSQTDKVTVSREQFTKLSEHLLHRIQQPIETTLRDANLRPSDLDDVILVGGATRMQSLRSAVAKMFRRLPMANIDPDLVVAMGAAIQAGLKARDQALDDVVLTDVCPYTLGTGVLNEADTAGLQGDLFSPILERNSVVPASRVASYFTVYDKQQELEFTIYQGESRLVKNNISLGSITVKVPKSKKGHEGAEVRFSYDMNGLLEVDIKVLSTGETYYKMIQNAPGELSEKELAASREKLSKLKFHPREEETNQLLIARAERLFESRLSEQRQMIQSSLKWFEGVLEKQNARDISNAQDEFCVFLDDLEQDRLF
ncbi:molecular chaperone HscC [Leucothrix mucor]|uniref:molecular chaperone HscC n=1 Tax=Leucothrix mucor TaxID=45248 RepID=UPI0003B4B3C3|nr:molecular chaperone HscC [Leucothrix mucor]